MAEKTIVVADASALIGLAKIKKLKLLQELFKEVYIPMAVYDDVVRRGKGKIGSKEVSQANWIKREKIKDKLAVEVLLSELKDGEAESIILAKELNADLVIIDEKKARTKAIQIGLEVIGVVGILAYGKELGLIEKDLKVYIDELCKNKFYIGDEVYQRVLELKI